MPRKAAVDTNSTPVEPRRSTRNVSQPKAEGATAPAKEKKPRANKKRTADEAKDEVKEGEASENAGTEGEQGSSKKAKGEVENEEHDELASDVSEGVKTLSIGDSLPTITLKDEKDEDIDIQGLASENGVVLFLVPKADTSGCTNQACGFRDIYLDFEAVNYKVYCVSADTSAAQNKWQKKFSLPYPLISDRQRELIKLLGAAEGKKTKRSHFIFEKGGKLLEKKMPVKPGDSPKLALDFIKALHAAA